MAGTVVSTEKEFPLIVKKRGGGSRDSSFKCCECRKGGNGEVDCVESLRESGHREAVQAAAVVDMARDWL